MATSPVPWCITPRISGHFTCYEERTDHVLSTVVLLNLAMA
jgi:hypothetical protein